MDQPPAVALTAFADAWPRAIETEIGAALCAIGAGRTLTLTCFDKAQASSRLRIFVYSSYNAAIRLTFGQSIQPLSFLVLFRFAF